MKEPRAAELKAGQKVGRMFMRWPAVFLLLIAGCVSFGPDAGRAVEDIEDRRFAAMVAADTNALAPLLGDDLTYIHSSGQRETKSEFLETVRSGAIRYRRIEPSQRATRRYGSVVIVTGIARVSIESGGQDRVLSLRHTSVYAKRRGAWQLVSWQSTRLPD